MDVKNFDPNSLLTTMSQSVLGCGSFATVICCKHGELGDVAVKCINVTGSADSIAEQIEDVKKRVKLMVSFKHENIVQVYGIVLFRNKHGIVMEMAPLGNLCDVLFGTKFANKVDISWSMKLKFFKEIACGLDFLHNHDLKKTFIHKDLKSENILVASGIVLKIADFGSFEMKVASGAKTFTNIRSNRQYTPYYGAPELVQCMECDLKEQLNLTGAIDVYSYGMIGYEIITRHKVFDSLRIPFGVLFASITEQGQKPNPQYIEEIDSTFSFTESLDKHTFLKLKSIMSKCWVTNPSLRPDISDVANELVEVTKVCNKYQETVTNDALVLERALVKNKSKNISSQASSSASIKKITLLQYLNKDSLKSNEKSFQDYKSNKPNASCQPFQSRKAKIAGNLISSVSSNMKITFTFDANVVYVVGGLLQDRILSSTVDCYFPEGNRWLQPCKLPHGLLAHASCVFHGMLYVIGGYDNLPTESATNNCHKYHPMFDTWTSCASMSVRRSGLSLGIIDNKIYAVGGGSDRGEQNSVERYDPESDTWTMVCGMKSERCYFGCVVVNETLYAVGGMDARLQNLASVERYDPGCDEWSFVNSMQVARGGAGVAAIGDFIYAVGGGNERVHLASVECYNVQDDTWTMVASMNYERAFLSVAAYYGMIYVFGGYVGCNVLSSVEGYDPKSNEWKEVANMSIGRWSCASAVGFHFLSPK